MPDPTAAVAEPALLFVPDISGFTQFVQSTEIAHSRHIIEELLDTLIEANTIGLQVSEIEGDAILFYRIGPAPTAEEYCQLVQSMFIGFHRHLKLYETQRICQCGACVSASSLTLKVVAHYGPITQSQVREHVSLFGQDVITVHRLLKNDIPHHEYALFTQALESAWPQTIAPAWAPREESTQQYDVGSIGFGYVALAPLRLQVPTPRVEDFSISGATVRAFSCEQVIEAPLGLVFGVASDLPARIHWMQGAKNVEMLNDDLYRLGTKHRCVIDKNSPVMVTSGSTHTHDTITLTETDDKKSVCTVYTFRQEGAARTRVRLDAFLKDNLALRILFPLLMKKKLTTRFQTSFENLKHYCEAQYQAQRA